PLVRDEVRREVPEHCPPARGVATELTPRLLVTHDSTLLSSRSGLGLLRLPPLEELRPIVDLHAQRQAHVREDLFDLLQRLTAEVLGLEHVLLGPLNELADERDVRVLEAVRRANRELELLDRAEEVLVQRLVVADADRRVARLLGLFEVHPDRELLLQDLR